MTRRSWFLAGFALVALLVAGALSYFADGDPDGLESVLDDGCQVVGEQVQGSCPAAHARDHALADGPLADYAVDGDDGFTGIAGIAGVAATFLVAGGLFWLLSRRSRLSKRSKTKDRPGSGTEP